MLKIANCNILNEEAQKFYEEYESAKFIFSSTMEFNSNDLDKNRIYILESIDDIQVSLKNLKNVIENSFVNDEN